MARFLKRRRFTRGRRFGGGGYPKFRKSRRITKRVRRVERSVKRINSTIETKQRELTYAFSDVSSTPTFAVLNYMPTGTADNQRIGLKVRATSMDINIAINDGTDVFNRVRVMIFWEKMPKTYDAVTGTPLESDILSYVSPTSNPTLTLMSGYNWQNRKRFRMIHDQIYTVYKRDSGNPHIVTIKKHFKLNKIINYLAPVGATYNSQYFSTNILWLCVFSDSASLSPGTHPTMTYFQRFKYQDA